MKKNNDILFNYLPVLFAFLMPFGLNLSVVIILWFVTSWFKVDKAYFLNGLKNKWFLTLVGFLVLHIISALLSDNKNESLHAIEVKLGFLAFPYFFFLFRIEDFTIKKMLTAFVSGCFFALMACLGRAGWLYLSEGENYFYYNKFSYFMHAGYFSMYMLFAIVVLFMVYPVWFGGDKWLNLIRYFFIAAFVVGVFLCASKIGIIAFLIVGLLIPLVKFKDVLSIKRVGIALIFLTALVVLLYNVLPTPFERLTNAFKTVSSGNIDKTSGESTAVRMLIWGESVEIIKEHFMFGVGVGDANDVLQARYKEQGLTGALAHNLNTHNQYFQTFIGLGVIGFVILLISTLGAMIYGLMKRNIILVLFCVIIILNFLVESMLQTQAGNLFYGCFVCLLLTRNVFNLSGVETKHEHKTV